MDYDTCWKGVGFNGCLNRSGYWYYEGVPGCNHWFEKFPRELFEKIIAKSDPIRDLIELDGSLLFSSS